VTEEPISALFWINILLGALLALTMVALGPAIAAFYGEPRLFGVTSVLAMGFIFTAAGVQHSAILQRQMRFAVLGAITVISLIVGTVTAIAEAEVGYGYWAIVAMSVAPPFITTLGVWLVTRWVPRMPRRRVGIRSMMHFGGTLTLNGFVAYIAYNAEKIMIGYLWGADAIGIYGRAYSVISIPTDNLNSAVGEVAFSALSRLQDDPARLKSYFLKGFSLVLGLTLPITIICALFADDVVFVLLGPKWGDATAIVRLLAPTIAIFAVINPLGWLIYSMGFVERGLKIALVFAPLMIAACVIGLPYGPKGVALAYSAVMVLWFVPHILWSVHGTPISLLDILLAASGPLASSLAAGVLAFGVRLLCPSLFPLVRLMVESSVLVVTFFGILLFVTGQKSLYLDLLSGWRKPSTDAEHVGMSRISPVSEKQ